MYIERDQRKAKSNLVCVGTLKQSVSQFDCFGLGEQPLDADDKEHWLVLANTRSKVSGPEESGPEHPRSNRVEQRLFRRRSTQFGDHDEISSSSRRCPQRLTATKKLPPPDPIKHLFGYLLNADINSIVFNFPLHVLIFHVYVSAWKTGRKESKG